MIKKIFRLLSHLNHLLPPPAPEASQLLGAWATGARITGERDLLRQLTLSQGHWQRREAGCPVPLHQLQLLPPVKYNRQGEAKTQRAGS